MRRWLGAMVALLLGAALVFGSEAGADAQERAKATPTTAKTQPTRAAAAAKPLVGGVRVMAQGKTPNAALGKRFKARVRRAHGKARPCVSAAVSRKARAGKVHVSGTCTEKLCRYNVASNTTGDATLGTCLRDAVKAEVNADKPLTYEIGQIRGTFDVIFDVSAGSAALTSPMFLDDDDTIVVADDYDVFTR